MASFPTGTVTFLFSDIEGSTLLLRRLGERWADVIADHNRLLRETFAAHGGHEVDRQGDAFFVAFPRARDAVVAAATAQRALTTHPWPSEVAVSVRMGIHTGEPVMGEEGYLGIDVVRAARICSAGHGGQVLVTETARTLVRGDELEGIELRDLGEHHLKDLEHPERVFQLVIDGLPAEFPPLRTLDEAPVEAEPGLEATLEKLGREFEQSIERYVADTIRVRRSGITVSRAGKDAVDVPLPESLRKLLPAALWLAGFVVLVLAAVLVAIVWLIASALS